MTTIPKRVKTLPLVIDSILNQTKRIDEVHLNIPFYCTRTEEEYDVTSLDSLDSRVKIFRTEDFGTLTKIGPTLLRTKDATDTLVLSVDDDFAYPNNTLERLLEVFDQFPRIITRYGGELNRMGDFQNWYGTGRASFLEGFGGVIYPTNVIKSDFAPLMNYVKRDLDLIKSDDIVLSTYFNFHQIEILLHNPIDSKSGYDMNGALEIEMTDALRATPLEDRRTMFRRAFTKTKQFLDTFWQDNLIQR